MNRDRTYRIFSPIFAGLGVLHVTTGGDGVEAILIILIAAILGCTADILKALKK